MDFSEVVRDWGQNYTLYFFQRMLKNNSSLKYSSLRTQQRCKRPFYTPRFLLPPEWPRVGVTARQCQLPVCSRPQSRISSRSTLTSETPRGGNSYCSQRGASVTERIHFRTAWAFRSAALDVKLYRWSRATLGEGAINGRLLF